MADREPKDLQPNDFVEVHGCGEGGPPNLDTSAPCHELLSRHFGFRVYGLQVSQTSCQTRPDAIYRFSWEADVETLEVGITTQRTQ